jgi:hypothetical protein
MSGFVFAQPPVAIKPVVVTGAATDTSIYTPGANDRTVTITDFQINATDASTGNLTVEIYDGTNHIYLGDDDGTTWNAQAITAHKSYKFTGPYQIPVGSALQFTNSSGNFVIVGNRLP